MVRLLILLIAFGGEPADDWSSFKKAKPACPTWSSFGCKTVGAKPKLRPRKVIASKPMKRRVIILTSESCGPCQALKKELAILKDHGWLIGDGPENHVQTIDVDEHDEAIVKWKVEWLPTCVQIYEEKELRRKVGAIDRWELGKLYFAVDPAKDAPEKPKSKD